jgi:hypothetical protein
MARGLSGGNFQGSFDAGAQKALTDSDSFILSPSVLSGSADAVNPHTGGNFIISTAGVDAITLAAPTAGVDDNLTISIYSDTTNAHTVTMPSALLAAGVALKTIATFAAFRGAGISLRAYNGVFQVIASTGIVLS